jgi:hypothetical protein
MNFNNLSRQLARNAIGDLVAARLHPLPPANWRLIEVPLELGHARPDLEFHTAEMFKR